MVIGQDMLRSSSMVLLLRAGAVPGVNTGEAQLRTCRGSNPGGMASRI